MRFPTSVLLGCSMVMIARAPEAAPSNGAITGTVKFFEDGKQVTRPIVGYVYLLPARRRGGSASPKPLTATIVQKDKKFTPDRLVIPVGSTVAFPNQEPRSRSDNDHNVFSPTDPTPFDLSRYSSGETRSRKFLDEGEFDIYCDIHVDMSAKVKVVETDRITVVTNGTFKLTDVPAGTYKVVAWAPDSAESKETITVVAGDTTRVPQLNVQVGRPKPHLRKDGSAYPIYDKNGR